MKPAGPDRVRELNEDMVGMIGEGSQKRECPKTSFILTRRGMDVIDP